MVDDDLQDDLTNARKVLIEMLHNWVKAIAAGYKAERLRLQSRASSRFSRRSR